MHLESPSRSGVHKHESSNLLRSAFQKAIERAADKQAAADQVTFQEAGFNESNGAACHSAFEREAVTRPAGDLTIQNPPSSVLATLKDEVLQNLVPDTSALAHLNSEVPKDSVPDESVQATDISSASQRLETGESRSIDTQEVAPADSDNHLIATSELMASPQAITSRASESPIARGGMDQQAFDNLSHLLSRQHSISDSQADSLTLKVIAGMPGVESLKVQQDQNGQWHLLLQLNRNSRRSEEQHRAELLAELSRRGHAMGSVSIHRQAGSALAEQDN